MTITLYHARSKSNHPDHLHSRLLHKCDTEVLKNDLGMAPWHIAEIFGDIDDQVNFWESLYLERHAPKRRFRVRAKSLPWIDDDLRNLMRYRDWLHRRAIRENSLIVWDIYKSARNKVTSDLRRAKTTYYHRLCSSNIPPAQLWKQLNNLLGSKNNCDVKSMVVNNRELTDRTEIAEAMNSHFIHAASPSTTPGTDPKPFSLSPATEDEVFGIVLFLDSNKSSGPSDINAKCLQLTISSIVTSIVRIINLSLQDGTVPSGWKAANVTPVFKKGDMQDPTNYRPISVIPVLGKILERVMYTRLMVFLSENNILNPFQSGFRHNHSTEDVLIRTVEDWRREVDQGKAIAAVFIDFSKAPLFCSQNYKTLVSRTRRWIGSKIILPTADNES